jgi:hypothetical protein
MTCLALVICFNIQVISLIILWDMFGLKVKFHLRYPELILKSAFVITSRDLGNHEARCEHRIDHVSGYDIIHSEIK